MLAAKESPTTNTHLNRWVDECAKLCEQVLGRPVEVESEPQRRRTHDRLELAADPRLLRETTGWEPTRSLHETLSELLTEPDES